MIKKILFILILVFGLSIFTNFVFASENQLEVDFFYSKTCSHCAKENKFLDELEIKYSDIKINRYEISEKGNADLLMEFYKEYNVPESNYGWVPITFIEGEYFSGFHTEIGGEIEDCILRFIEGDPKNTCESTEDSEKTTSTLIDLKNGINLPFVGKVDLSKYSLPALTIILGTLDGFNVCSLGALILILGLVIAMKSRKKILIFGITFILTTSIVYGILIFVWYQIFSVFASYLKIMELLIGILAVGGAIYFFKQFFKFRKQGVVCETGASDKIAGKFSSKIKNSLQNSKNIFLIIGAILLFAGMITIVEFPCSAAIPLIFSSILVQSELSTLSYIFYIILFLFFYMLDEIIVFLFAFFTMKIWISSNKITKWITLIEAIILLLLGLYYLFGFGILQ
ncbi:MAG: hypothetical protein ABH956_01885 [Candidatus Nealsonbacteria bacterium]